MSDTTGNTPAERPQTPEEPPVSAQGDAPEASAPTPERAAPVTPPVPPMPPHPGRPAYAYGAATPGAPAQPAYPAQPAQPSQPGQSFGAAAHQTQPTVPFAPTMPYTGTGFGGNGAAIPAGTAMTSQKSKGSTKVAGLIVAAALVGGLVGLGGAAAGNALWGGQTSSTVSTPSAVTVNNPDDVNATTAIAAKALPSVVTIEVSSASSGGSGSGVVLTSDGYIATNTHVVTLDGASDDARIRVTTSDGRIYDAEVVGTDPTYDLAVIKLVDAEGLTPVEFADSSDLNVGAVTVAVGAPLGLANTVTTGIVSALNRSIEIASSAVPESTGDDDSDSGEGTPPEQGQQGGPFTFDIPGRDSTQNQPTETISIAVIQTDAAINPGNSGGALVDAEGRLIGINVAIATAGSSSESGSIGVGFSIPSNVVKRITGEIIDDGAATHGLLGASVQAASSIADSTQSGAYIASVSNGAAAAAAGLREGDVVTEFNGVPISDATDLTAQVRAAASGSDATLTYVRDGEATTVDVTLGSLGG